MPERTVKFGWWRNHSEIVSHEAIFSIPNFQTVKVSLGQWVSDFVICGFAANYPSTPPPVFAQGTTSCEVDLPAGTFVASCGRSQDFEASASVTYHV